eukprot:226044_1
MSDGKANDLTIDQCLALTAIVLSAYGASVLTAATAKTDLDNMGATVMGTSSAVLVISCILAPFKQSSQFDKVVGFYGSLMDCTFDFLQGAALYFYGDLGDDSTTKLAIVIATWIGVLDEILSVCEISECFESDGTAEGEWCASLGGFVSPFILVSSLVEACLAIYVLVFYTEVIQIIGIIWQCFMIIAGCCICVFSAKATFFK